MRLDKFLSVCAVSSRSDTKRAVSRGEVLINGIAVKRSDVQVDPERDTVTFCGKRVVYNEYEYILLNKPEGYVSATDDPKQQTVLDLLPPELKKKGVFPCGRLDKNTLGLVLITNDGELSHRLLSPRNHVKKKYRFRSRRSLSAQDERRLTEGIELEDGYLTKPCEIELLGNGDEGMITLHEGKYHQIKRMLEAVDNKITYLERVSFAQLSLERESLARGEWRYLSADEVEELKIIAGLSAKENK